MPEIKKEHPQGQRSIEMQLVEMLTEKRNWNDYTVINSALSRIRRHAKSMQDDVTNVKAPAEKCDPN